MRGSCSCNNISVSWHNFDSSLVPRKCGCEYCSSKNAAYVSKSGTAVEAVIRKANLHRILEHGSGQAKFHECGYCGDVVLVTVSIQNIQYCALNINCLEKRAMFPEAVNVNFSDRAPREKFERWQQNWCYPAVITS